MKAMNKQFDLLIETRGLKEGTPNYVIKGYATTSGNAYAYKYFNNKGKNFSLKEMFTVKGLENFRRKCMSRDIFVDALHEISTLHNTKNLLKKIQDKSMTDISEEANAILTSIKHSDVPIAKLHSIDIDEKGLFVETRLNPSYRNVDEAHQKYFDAVWGSLQEGFLNKFSIDFNPKYNGSELVDGELIPKIDDVDVFGISYKQGAANDFCDITEVAIRGAVEHSEELKRMEEDKTKMENEDLKRQIDALKKDKIETLKAEETRKTNDLAKELEESRKSIEAQKIEMQKMKEELEKKVSESKAQVGTQAHSVAPQENQFRNKSMSEGNSVVQKALELAPEINEPKSGNPLDRYGFYKNPRTKSDFSGKIGLGEALHLQAMLGSQNLETPETQHWLRKRTDDITVPRRAE